MVAFLMAGLILEFRGLYRFLNSFYPWPVVSPEDGMTYPTNEHAFQAAKSENLKTRTEILHLPTPQLAKEAGRKLALRPDWEDVKRLVMFHLVLSKFSDEEMARRLVATGRAELVEGNTWGDDFWGAVAGPGEVIPSMRRWTGPDGTQYQGHNYLGQILMAVRMLIEPAGAR